MSSKVENTADYKKNQQLEQLLANLNNEIEKTEPLDSSKNQLPIIFVVGVPRSGTTLMTQWLASLALFNYPTNFISRFFKNPYVGFLIQQMLFEEEFNYKNELNLVPNTVNFRSDVGKTIGPKEPHEFWYFWREHFAFPEIPVSNAEFMQTAHFDSFRSEIAKIQNFNNKAFFIKSLIANDYIESFSQNIPNSIFIYIKRDPIENAKSLLSIRKKYLGDENHWFSFKPKNYDKLEDRNKYEQVAGQVHHINQEITRQLADVPAQRKLEINYEEFCAQPAIYYQELREKLATHQVEIPTDYTGKESFPISNNTYGNDDELLNAFKIVQEL